MNRTTAIAAPRPSLSLMKNQSIMRSAITSVPFGLRAAHDEHDVEDLHAR